MSPSVVILDDHPLVRDSIASRLATAIPGVHVAYAGVSVRGALDALHDLDPLPTAGSRCAILDLDLGDDRSPADSAAALADAGAAVVMVSAHDQPALVQEAVLAGARAYVPKRALADDLPQAVLALASGHAYRSADFATVLVPAEGGPVRLDPAVQRVLVLHAAGLPMPGIAQRLGLPPADVATLLEQAWAAYRL